MVELTSLQSCPRVPGWPAALTWECADTLSGALSLPMHCVRDEQERFRGGMVHLGWDGGHLLVSATLSDDHIYCEPDDGRPLWQLGDVFEVFFRDPETLEYFELHIAPSGLSRAHRFSSREDIRALHKKRIEVSELVIPDYPWDFLVQVRDGGWRVLARLPWPGRTTLEGSNALVSFSRYDYTDGESKAVLSSTSRHVVPRFHRYEEWVRIAFVS